MLHQVEYGRKGFAPHDGRLLRHLHERRPHVIGARKAIHEQPLPAHDDASGFAGFVERLSHDPIGVCVDQRADQRGAVAGIADRYAGVSAAEAPERFVVDRFVQEQPPQRRAPLPGGSHRGEGDGAHGEIEAG